MTIIIRLYISVVVTLDVLVVKVIVLDLDRIRDIVGEEIVLHLDDRIDVDKT